MVAEPNLSTAIYNFVYKSVNGVLMDGYEACNEPLMQPLKKASVTMRHSPLSSS